MGKMINRCKYFVGKHERRALLGKSRCKWKKNIKVSLIEVRLQGMWTGFMWLRFLLNNLLVIYQQYTKASK
jgi:hypothetical protein